MIKIGTTIKWSYDDPKTGNSKSGVGHVQSRTIVNGEPILWVTPVKRPLKHIHESLIDVPEQYAKTFSPKRQA